MVIYKLAGAALMIAAGFGAGRRMVRAEKSRIDCLNGFVVLIRYIRSQIENYMLPIDEIIKKCDREIISSCGCATTASSLDEVIDSASALDEPMRDELRKFARTLGNGNRLDEAGAFKSFEARLVAARDKLAAELPRRERLIMTLSISAAVGLTIILF